MIIYDLKKEEEKKEMFVQFLSREISRFWKNSTISFFYYVNSVYEKQITEDQFQYNSREHKDYYI